jgi:hypothetical protein
MHRPQGDNYSATRSTCNLGRTRDNRAEMSGILFDLPSLRFLRRFRFFENMMRTFASSLLRWLTARACGPRQVRFRLNEAEFPAASQSVCKLLEWTLSDSRAADCASIDALRPFNYWFNLKDQHELLFIRETPSPFARWIPTQEQWAPAPSTGRSESSEENVLGAGCGIFWKRQRQKAGNNSAQRCAAIPAATQT